MKKHFLYLALAGFLAVSCSDNDQPADNGTLTGGEGITKGYLAINLVSAGGFTRATYQNGTADESYVNMVRFYFFDTDGNPVPVRKNPDQEAAAGDSEYFSYYDWSLTPEQNSDATGDESITVEKTLTTTLTLSGPEEDEYPDNMLVLTVINPPASIKSMTNVTLPELRNAVADYSTNQTGKGTFIMTNSVFVDKDGNLIEATPMGADNISSTLTGAQDNPLVVFVERVVARLDFSTEMPMEDGLVDINTKFDPIDPSGVPEGTYTGDLYLKVTGWAVTSATNKSNLVKQVNADWESDMFGNTEPWNSSDFSRSFWAINPEAVTKNPLQNMNWYSYDEITGNGLAIPSGTSKTTVYMQENANPFEAANMSATGANPNYPTKVIITGQICDPKGNPVTIAEYNQEYYTLEGLTKYVANYLNLWWLNGSTYVKVAPEDLTFITKKGFVSPDEFTAPDVSGTYYVYFTLTEEAAQKTWYHQAETSGNYTTVTNVNTFIFDSVGRAMVWNQGRNYYYFDIKHLGAEGFTGYQGVVRNHLYDATLNSLSGLGTPVYDPKETIYPEKPYRYGNMISATIEVLQWRLVGQDFDLAW